MLEVWAHGACRRCRWWQLLDMYTIYEENCNAQNWKSLSLSSSETSSWISVYRFVSLLNWCCWQLCGCHYCILEKNNYSTLTPALLVLTLASLWCRCVVPSQRSHTLYTVADLASGTLTRAHWGLLQCRISSILAKSRSFIKFISVAQSFWYFAQSTAVSLPYSMQHFKTSLSIRNY